MVHRKDSSSGQIYRELRHRIIMGNYGPGERLGIDDLAKEFSTSITPVRDALQALAQENLIVNKPRVGFFVPSLSLKELNDMLDLREILESVAVQRAAARITHVQLEELESVHEGYTGDDEESCERYITENRKFHYLVAKASGNDKLAEMVGFLHDQLLRYFVFVHTGDAIEKRHNRLMDALRARDPELASQVIRDEMAETRVLTIERVIQKEGVKWLIEEPARTITGLGS